MRGLQINHFQSQKKQSTLEQGNLTERNTSLDPITSRTQDSANNLENYPQKSPEAGLIKSKKYKNKSDRNLVSTTSSKKSSPTKSASIIDRKKVKNPPKNFVDHQKMV